MSTEETNDEINEFSDHVPAEPAESAPEAKPGWSRRNFLKAAALGAAAAALVNRGTGGSLHLGAASALADDLSSLNCTANDVRIVGPGIILNEPCNCTSTFNAQVQFHVINNTGTNRYCVTVHLCPATINGKPFPQTDIVIGDIPANFDGLKTVQINNYPCGSGLVCFGAAGSQPDGSFLKGEACPTGKCCTTISWNVKASDPCPDTTRPISSKCRHQQVCIQGRSATLSCVSNCTPDCGGTATLQLCGSGGVKPYTFSLSDGTNTYQPASISSDGNCATFNVQVSQTTTFTGTVTDSGNPACAEQSNSVTLNATPLTISVSAAPPDCAGGNTVITVLPTGLAKYTFTIDGGQPIDNGTNNVLSTVLQPGGHTIVATGSNAQGCTATASTTVTVPTAVTLTAITRSAGCDGVVTLSATAGGGTPPYTFTWKVNGVVQTSGISSSPDGATSTLTLQPQLNGVCRTVEVSVVDSKGCGPSAQTNSFSQCVNTTGC